MIFLLSKSFTKQSAPAPDTDNVELITVKGRFHAVSKYSGRSTNQNYNKQATYLKRPWGTTISP